MQNPYTICIAYFLLDNCKKYINYVVFKYFYYDKITDNKKGAYLLTVPIDKIKRANLEVGNEFDVDITSGGNLIFVKIKK